MALPLYPLKRLIAPLVPYRFRRGTFAQPPLLGYLDRPVWQKGVLTLRGWVVSRGDPIETLHLRIGRRDLPLERNLERPDILRTMAREPDAATAGFAIDAGIAPDVTAIQVWATLHSGRHLLAFSEPVPHRGPKLVAVNTTEPALPLPTPTASQPQPVASFWRDAEYLIRTRRPRIVIELDAPARDSRTIALTQQGSPDAVLYLVGPCLGTPDYDSRVCVIDAVPADALDLFVDGTVGLILANRAVSEEWRRKLEVDGAVLGADGTSNLTLKSCHDPDVSVVIPMHGRVDLTIRCLRSLAIYQSALRAEVIVVDDGSPDDLSGLSAHPGARLVQLPRNEGFGNACNRGAQEATSRYLVFLNNDTEVTANWLDELHRTFVDEPDAGLVGAKLVYPDGRLQEAGGAIFRDGSAMNVGRDGDPEHPSYNMMREVDYCSAACIMIPTDLFRQLGGFDPLFAPAYYEDGDLAFRVRQLGRRVLYQPLSCVIHYEGGTSGTDLTRGPKRFQILNQDKFRRRWASELSQRPERAVHPVPVAAGAPARRVLVIDHAVPSPDRDAGSVRMDRLLKLLQKRGLRVTFISGPLSGSGTDTANLRRRGIEVMCAPWVRSVREHLVQDGARYDIVLLSRRDPAEAHLSAVLELAPQSAVVFDTVDLHFVRESLAAQLCGDAAALALASARQQVELELMRRSDITVVVSAAEARLLARDYAIPDAVVISTIHDVLDNPPPFNQRRDLVFVGYFEHAPNADGMLWFAREVMPHVLSRLPGVRLHVIGSGAPEELGQFNAIEIHGRVPNVEAYLDSARVMVAPLRFGAGVKGKITQSLSRGLPVVGTTVAFEGMEVAAGEHVLVGDTPVEFADAVARAYRDAQLWSRLSERGREVARQHYSVEAGQRSVEALLQRVAAIAAKETTSIADSTIP